jgi:hypothetical protein
MQSAIENISRELPLVLGSMKVEFEADIFIEIWELKQLNS